MKVKDERERSTVQCEETAYEIEKESTYQSNIVRMLRWELLS